MNREAWLDKLTTKLRPLFQTAGYPLPEKVKVTCGWPVTGGMRSKGRILGQCCALTASEAGVHELFISPYLAEPLDVAETLTHELAHAAVGTEAAHKGVFVDCIRALGLEGKPTTTHAGEELAATLEQMCGKLGEYPHARLNIESIPKQSTRLLKVLCPGCEYTVRITQKWIEVGLPTCPCGKVMVRG